MRHSFAAPTATAMTDFPYSDHHNFSDFDGVVGDRQDYFSFSELLNDPIPPMDSSSPSPDHSAAVAGPVGGAFTFPWDVGTSGSGPGFPVTASGFVNPPRDFPSLLPMQCSSSVLYQQYPSSSSTEPYSHQLTTNHQLLPKIEPSPDSNILLAVSESRKDKRPVPMDKPARDGYNWRKYGQKPIKDCKYSRSYYKCTHKDCLVTKKVQHSMAGHVTHIFYSGSHIHKRPQSGRRANGKSFNHTPVPTDSEDSADAYMRFDEDDEGAEGSNGGATSETATGPKFVVQTRSEIEVLDDGYRWRKYGQKVVKGNSNPRSYYKCTSNGCCVRKQVERSSKDPEAVITTYDGKHDHDVPARQTQQQS